VIPIRTEADIDALVRSAKALAVIAAWNELGAFRALAHGPRPLSELPGDRRALAITAPVLQHLGLLLREGDEVALSSTTKRLLEAGQLPSAKSFGFLRDHAHMLDVLRHGGPLSEEAVTEGGVEQDDPQQTARFLDMLYALSAESAPLCHQWLSNALPVRGSVLDVGGGHGRYARTFADAGHSATLFDFPHVVDYARAKHAEALTYLAGNFRDDETDFGGPYDLILLSNIVHGEPEPVCRRLVSRLVAHLAPGGQLVLKDMFIDDHGRDPENAVFFGLTMLFYTRAGRSHTLAAARSWLEAAALKAVSIASLDGFQLVRGTKA
jgi:SAM-dependent methyltransferase